MWRMAATLLVLLFSAACANGSVRPVDSPGQTTAHAIGTQSTCRLPVVVRRLDATTRTWSPDTSGFLAYPDGGFTAANAHGVRYDADRNLWLPAGVPIPDRAGYVYADPGGAIHEVRLDSGLDRVVVAGSWVPIGFVGSLLYVAESRFVTSSAFAGGGYTEGGLAKTDLRGGKPIPVTQHSGPWWVSSLGAWTLDRADGMRQAPDRVLHVDLATGAITPWLSDFGNASVAGFDAGGHPFVVTQGGVEVRLIRDANSARSVYKATPEIGRPETPSYTNGNEVWFSGFSTMDATFEAPAWLYKPESGLRTSIGVPGAQVRVAGPCL